MNFYLTGIEGMPRLLECCAGDPTQYFKKKVYTEAFQRMYQEHVATFDAIEQGYCTVIDKDQFLTNMADALTARAAEKLDTLKKKSLKERAMMDLNLTMAVFVLPMVLEYHGQSSKPLAEHMIASWKRTFPKSSLQAAEFSYIEEGFHKKFCYITTAVCETLGKADDCYELSLLRDYRDGYLASLPDGEALIRMYYDVAPSIVKHINQCADSGEIYRSIWEDYLNPCIGMIEDQKLDECRRHYEDMVYTLKDQYFYRCKEDSRVNA